MVFTTQIFIFAFFPLCVVAYLLADRVEKIGRFGVWLKKLRAKDVLLIAFSLVFCKRFIIGRIVRLQLL